MTRDDHAADGRTGSVRVLWLVKGLGPGGAERLMVAAAGAHDREVVSLRTAYLLPWKDALVGDLEALDVPCTCLDVRNERDVRWAARLRRMLVESPVDVLHAQSPYPAGIARLVVRSLPRRIRPRLVYTVHNTWTSFSRPTRWLNGATYGFDDADVAVSEIVRDTLPSCVRNRTETVIHGIDLAGVRAQRALRGPIRTELGIGADEVVVGTVANFRAQKDYPNLLAAARLLTDRGVPVRIVAVGQGPQEEETRALHASLDLGDHVILTGRRADAVAVMGACDAFVMASNNEGLPVAIMEALALGLPVVSTAVGGIPEAITDDVEGLLVPARDPEALAAAITRVVTEPALRARLAAGAAAAGDRYDITGTARRLEEIYVTITGSPDAGGAA
ncbi:MAG: glycosyltransferase [Actinomycetes bacterium]